MRLVVLWRVLAVVAAIALLEVLCLAGAIDRITMPPPHEIARDLWRMLVSGRMNGAIRKTLTNAAIAFASAAIAGVAVAALLHGHRQTRQLLDKRR